MISTDPDRVDVVQQMLAVLSYRPAGRSLDTQRGAIGHSHLVAGTSDTSGCQVGFGPMVTDSATFARLADVAVLDTVRDVGLGSDLVERPVEGLVERLEDRPDDVVLTWQFLATRGAHDRYGGFGDPARAESRTWMRRRGPN